MITFYSSKIDVGNNSELFSLNFEKHKNYNFFTSFMYANALKEKGLPADRSYAGIWFELLGHHIVNTYDLFNIIDNDDSAEMGNRENDGNAWIWESAMFLFGGTI